jgi:hypothetical protein
VDGLSDSVVRSCSSRPPQKPQRPPGGDRRPGPAFDVIAHASVKLTAPGEQASSRLPFSVPYVGRSHSLWYCDAQEAGRYQWFETAFMLSPLVDPTNIALYIAAKGDIRSEYRAPFSLDPGWESALALLAGMDRVQVAWPLSVVSVGELDEFIDRWTGWLADAALGRLQHPSELPERPTQGGWRQS